MRKSRLINVSNLSFFFYLRNVVFSTKMNLAHFRFHPPKIENIGLLNCSICKFCRRWNLPLLKLLHKPS